MKHQPKIPKWMSGLLFGVSDRNGCYLVSNTPQNVTTDQSESGIPESRVIKADNWTILKSIK